MSGGKGRTVLFQGDSITDGSWRRDGNDPNAALGHSYAYLIAAQLGCERADSGHRFVNRGVSGNRVSDLYARWNEDAFHLNPDIISILIGVNDAWRIESTITVPSSGSWHGSSKRNLFRFRNRSTGRLSAPKLRIGSSTAFTQRRRATD